MCRSTNTVPHVLMTSTITPQPLPPPPPQAQPSQPSQPINNSNNRRINIDSSPPEPFNIARIVTQVEEGKKSVRFANIDDNQADEIRYFERISSIDSKNVWYNESELYSFVQEGKKLALAYRNTLTTTSTTSTTTTSTTTNAHAHAHAHAHQDDYSYRGFENYTIERQKHRLLSNRFNVLIQHRNSQDNDISINTVNDDDIQQLDDISQQCSNWSTNVALLTAINDYFVSYGGDDDEDGDNNYCDETSSYFPSVTDMIPPEFPIGIQRIMLFSSSIAIQQSRKRTRTHQTASTATANNASNSNSDVIRRRVKQRVVY